MDNERQVDPFIIQSRFVSPQELSEIPCLVDRRCLVVNKLLNYESLGVVHRRNEILIKKWRSKRARSNKHTFPAHGAPTTTTLIGFITGGRVTLETRASLPLSGPPSRQVLYVRSW